MKNRVLFTIITPLCLAACAIIPPPAPSRTTAPPSGQPAVRAPLHLPGRRIPAPNPSPQDIPFAYAALHETALIDGMRITPLKVLEDSRCPTNARCVWVGRVRLRIQVDLGSRGQTMEIASDKPAQLTDGTLALVEVKPDKMTNKNNGAVALTTYRFGFRFDR